MGFDVFHYGAAMMSIGAQPGTAMILIGAHLRSLGWRPAGP